ncbi:uncharacterized protein LOC130743766 [Lotus japonicus]|uniref:uncharacterized protein LOC130743766 n=1 Tax=Lotus japonicus TaxID=34305 RepID=UPI00258BB05C|nr:uncharacterized protein LOC130743766 [Lotus japonicus]
MNRLWLNPSLYGLKLPFSMDMVLMDDKGCKIHATVRKTLIYRFQSLLSEGSVYQISFFGVGESGRDFRPTSHQLKINFDIHTFVRLVPNKAINLSPYCFVPLSDIMFKDLDMSFLIGKTSLQNVYGATRVLFNSLIQEAAPLRARFLESNDPAAHVISPLQDSAKKSTPEDDFLKQSDGTIEQLKDLAERVWIGITLRESIARRYILLTEATALLNKSCANLLETIIWC